MPIRRRYSPYDVERTRKAIAYLAKHYAEPISADQLAEEVMIDKRKLQAVIQVLTGLTVHRYLLKVRLDRATEYLRERVDLTIEQVANLNGFHTSSLFIRHFRKRTGMTPKEYRFRTLNTGKAL
jgi:two-component system response regulator YesN